MSDLSGVVNEQRATIEALRRRVAELEGERDTANKYLDEVLDRGNKTLRARDALTAENAKLKRQVEALREACEEFYDAVLHDRHQLAEEGMMSEQTNSVLGIYDDTIGNALAAKGEVE